MALQSSLQLHKDAGSDSRPLRIVQISDTHILSQADKSLLGVNTEESFLAVVELVKQQAFPPDLIVLTGDLAQEPGINAYSRLKLMLTDLKVPCVCLPGNHDEGLLMVQHLHSNNIYCVTQVLAGNWQLICLDSSLEGSEGGHLSEETLQLLSTYLQQHSQKPTLVFLHHHPILIGSHWLDTMAIDNADQFFKILNKHPQVSGIAFGHIHQIVDTRYQNVRILGAPSSCFQFKPNCDDFVLDNKPPGYREITLYPNGQIETSVSRIANLPPGLDFSSPGY